MYLKPSELADMFKLNKQTLFYYEKEGLFLPAVRDPNTGYRKYAFQQIYRLALICYLRRIGFSIEQIRGYLEHQSVDLNIKVLKQQSATIRKQCEQILNIDSIIQRKLLFIEQKMANMELDRVTEKCYLKRAYLPLGTEERIYAKDAFYFHPTIAIYEAVPGQEEYDKTFGAYLETVQEVDAAVMEDIRYIDAHKFLCCFWKGHYTKIEQKIRELRSSYRHLLLSPNTYNFNIIDQFLENDGNEYITEIQIPILE